MSPREPEAPAIVSVCWDGEGEMPDWLVASLALMQQDIAIFNETGHVPRRDNPRPAAGDALQGITQTCACSCWHNHPQESGICTAGSDPGAVIEGEPVCRSCHVATTLHRPLLP